MVKMILAALFVSATAAVNAGDFSVRLHGGYADYYHRGHSGTRRDFRSYNSGYPVYGYHFYSSPFLYRSHYYGDRYSKYYGHRKHYSRRDHHRLGRHGRRHRHSHR
jgi:hypothetical protein